MKKNKTQLEKKGKEEKSSNILNSVHNMRIRTLNCTASRPTEETPLKGSPRLLSAHNRLYTELTLDALH